MTCQRPWAEPIDNSIEFTFQLGSDALRDVQVSWARDNSSSVLGRYNAITFRDNGVGMDHAQLIEWARLGRSGGR